MKIYLSSEWPPNIQIMAQILEFRLLFHGQIVF